MSESIQQILNQASEVLENFVNQMKSEELPSSENVDDLSRFLKESHNTLNELKSLKEYDISTAPTLKMIQKIQTLLTEIHKFKPDRSTQEKAGVLQASLFWNTIEDFQKLIKNLKDEHKRGIRAEKIEPLDPEAE